LPIKASEGDTEALASPSNTIRNIRIQI